MQGEGKREQSGCCQVPTALVLIRMLMHQGSMENRNLIELVQILPRYKLTLICPKNSSKSKKDGNWWTLCLQTSCYDDQKFICAKRTMQKPHTPQN